MSFDPRCYELAELFLSDSPEKNTEANRNELAQAIQSTIEDTITYGLTAASAPERPLCSGCDGHECNDRCQYPMIDPFQHQRS